MHDRHVDPKQFVNSCYEYGDLSPEEAWATHLHQVRACPGCLKEVLRYYGLQSFEELASLDNPGTTLRQRAEEMDQQPRMAWLETLPLDQQVGRIRSDPSFQSAALACALVSQCKHTWSAAPEKAENYAVLALAVARKVSPRDPVLPLGGVPELYARIWAHLGNVHRIQFDFLRAQLAFHRAESQLNDEWADDEIMAEILQLKSSMLRAQRRFDAAKQAIDRAIRLFELAQTRRRQGEAFLVSAKIRLAAQEPEEALQELERAEPLLSSAVKDRHAFLLRSIQLDALTSMGRFARATSLLPLAQRLGTQTEDPHDALCIRWCEARIAAGLGQRDEAERLFKSVRAGFLKLDCAYDVALVSLELAQFYAKHKQHALIQRLARQMVPIFQSREIHREALAATQLFADAVRSEGQQQELITKLSAYLANARHDPEYRFSL